MEQLSLFGITPDQNTYNSVKWGTLTFYPAQSHKWTDTCRHCLLWDSVLAENGECAKALCYADERTDGKNGYFSIFPSAPTYCHTYKSIAALSDLILKHHHHGNN